ncbi:hypothetical protein [Psittacicella melopsittaci]|uniref:hypothetical protein n=1 Tax=Psittacicella melopsittaci TaxID=2028576 RepID=UPI001CA5F732|nr:hypothetical protein [Psittacicella melopsittaci]
MSNKNPNSACGCGHDHEHQVEAHQHDHACGCGHDHEHEHNHACGCGHDHEHEHSHACGCGHDHEHEHSHACGCGHDHEHQHNHACGCGHDHEHDHEHSHACGCGHDHEHDHEHEHSHACGCGHDHGHVHHHHEPQAVKLNFDRIQYDGDDDLIPELIQGIVAVRESEKQQHNLIFKSKQSAIKELINQFKEKFGEHPSLSPYHLLGLVYTWTIDPNLSAAEFEKHIRFMAEGDKSAQVDGIDSEFILLCEKLRSSFLQDLIDIDNFQIANLFMTFLDENEEEKNDPYNLLIMIKEFTLGVATMGSYLAHDNANGLSTEEKLESQNLLQALYNIADIMNGIEFKLALQATSYPESVDDLMELNFNLSDLFDDIEAFIFLTVVLTYDSFAKGLPYPATVFDLTNAYLISL